VVPRCLIATRSPHKLGEIRQILADLAFIELIDLQGAGVPEEPQEHEIEKFDTFAENAVAKARHFGAKSGLPTIADDSGLVVDALAGEPGVRSKRYASAQAPDPESADRLNNERLLQRLGDTPLAQRTARYVCVAALALPGGGVHTFHGTAEGLILGHARGTGGFGYDPLFYDQRAGMTFAEMTPAEKNARSHRGRALRAVGRFLSEQRDRLLACPTRESDR